MTTARARLADPTTEMAEVRDEVHAAVSRVLDSGRYVLGPEVEQFEREVAERCGCRHAIGVSSGSDALVAALLALGVGPGDEVITTALSFVATAMAIVRVGARPIFVDIEDSSLLIDPTLVARARGPRTKAIVPVHLFGRMADVRALEELGVPVVEDAAQAFGAERGGRQAGAAATLGCLSFFPSKNLGGAGDGGMVLTDDAELADRVRRARVQGQGARFVAEGVGGNYRLDELQAAILRVKLRRVQAWNAARRARAAAWRTALWGSAVRLPEDVPGHAWNHYAVRCADRDALRARLEGFGVETGVYYPVPLHRQSPFAAAGASLPVAERACGELLSLPVHPSVDLGLIARAGAGCHGI